MRILLSIFFILTLSQTTFASVELKPDPRWLKKELTKMGLRKSFIELSLENYQSETFETVMKLNLLGFLQPPQHMDRVTSQSVDMSLRFLNENQDSLKKAYQKYKIPPQVISALLWIETRHGDDRGSFHIVSVFLHLLQAQRPENRKALTEMAIEINQKTKEYTVRNLRKVMKERSRQRARWAKEQILALTQIHRQKKLDLKTLKGSFAGAFGIPQFIPSSYRDFAKASRAKTSPDLYHVGDAIMSVANYLRRHGWNNRKTGAQIAALMKYNNSRDYAESILEISARLKANKETKKTREVTSVK